MDAMGFGMGCCCLQLTFQAYNDIPITHDPAIYRRLREGGIDHPLAMHVAHLFIRDSVSLFSEKVNQDDMNDTDHFETMRFKPPPPNSSIGWRVEFRPCEAQLTDFENAAYVCFVVLLTRVILSYNLNFLMPISKVDENMQRAQRRGACLNEKFWWRRDVGAPSGVAPLARDAADEYAEMTIAEISYLSGMDVDADTHCSVQQYLKLIQRRASGEIATMATWMRDFDSIVTEKINYDLLKKAHGIQTGTVAAPSLLGGTNVSKTNEDIPKAFTKMMNKDC
ncbi:Gamma-glutamylcysteine ligase, partial [Operophtera brumata]